jgi:hypothetical protein
MVLNGSHKTRRGSDIGCASYANFQPTHFVFCVPLCSPHIVVGPNDRCVEKVAGEVRKPEVSQKCALERYYKREYFRRGCIQDCLDNGVSNHICAGGCRPRRTRADVTWRKQSICRIPCMKIVTHLSSYFETYTHSKNGSNTLEFCFSDWRENWEGKTKKQMRICRVYFVFEEFCFQDSAYQLINRPQ